MSRLDVFRPTKHIDYLFALLTIGLALLGLAMISSASAVISYERFGHISYYVIRQAIALIIGVIVMVVCTQINYRLWQKIAAPLMIIAIGLLIAVFIPGLGTRLGGAHRWIDIGPLLIQPSEFAKPILIIYLSTWFYKKGRSAITDTQKGLIPFFTILGLVVLLVIKQPDLGTVVIIGLVALTMFHLAGAPLAKMLTTVLVVSLTFGFFVLSAPYRWTRLTTFINPAADTQGAGYQINQSLIAIGSGGWFGLGFGQSRQKYLYLPQPHIDSIFAIVVEELGFLRSLAIILLFLAFTAKAFRIAKLAPDQFGQLLAGGIASWILFQFFVNIGAITHIIPLTGVPLPFISYGGSALVSLMAGVGILLNISRHTR